MKITDLKLFDYIIFTISILIIAGFIIITKQSVQGEPILKITSTDEEYIYQLDSEIEIDIAGPIGNTHIHIRDGEAFIESSPCENQLCVMMGSISKTGQWAACMPNRIFISIEGGSDETEIDVLSY